MDVGLNLKRLQDELASRVPYRIVYPEIHDYGRPEDHENTRSLGYYRLKDHFKKEVIASYDADRAKAEQTEGNCVDQRKMTETERLMDHGSRQKLVDVHIGSHLAYKSYAHMWLNNFYKIFRPGVIYIYIYIYIYISCVHQVVRGGIWGDLGLYK